MNHNWIGVLLNERYRLDAELGRGGMGVVYRAHDILLDRDVAVKVLSSSALGSEGRTRLLWEAKAIARLSHPNIVRVYDAGQSGDTAFVVMELLTGESLFEKRPTALDEIIAITCQVCAALEHAHANGIIHRDLKLENVIVSHKGVVTLTDFGLARSLASRITVEGAIVGTVYYLAPEQALGQAVDSRTDLYALGVILYELTARRLPFSGDDPLAVISQHLYAPVVPPSTHNPNLPPAWDALIVKMLSKQPDDRPASAGEVARALEELTTTQLTRPAQQAALSPLDRLARGRLIGREPELAEAKAAWKQVTLTPGERHVLVIHGEPGVGKTPLVREIKALAEVTGGRVLTGECYPDGRSPYAPIAQIVRAALSSAATPIGRGETLVEAMELPGHVLSSLIQLAPDLQVRHPQTNAIPSFDPQEEQHRLFESVVALFATVVTQTPLLLVVEDVHWADGGTLFLLRHLARRSRALRLKLLILLTYRDTEIEEPCCLSEVLDDLTQERLVANLHMDRFTREQTGVLLDAMFQEKVAPEILDAIYQVTEGNLFFVEEVCKALIEEGRLYREDGHWRHSNIESIHIPDSVQATIRSRVSKLTGEVQEILRLAAIIGREFDFDTLQKASGLGEETLIDALEIAGRAQLIGEVKPKTPDERLSAQVSFTFAHSLILTTLRESLSSLRRRSLHRRVAAAIEELRLDDEASLEILAFHHERAGEVERAQKYYGRAGERALAVFANQEAEQFFRSAQVLSPSDADRSRVLSGLGEALFRQSRYREAGQTWQAAIGLYRSLGDHDNLARLYARSARAAWYAGDAAHGMQLCQEGLETTRAILPAPEEGETPGMAALLHETARAYRFNDQFEQALPLCHQALSMAKRLGLVEVQAETLATLGIIPNQPPEAQREALTQAIELAESAGFLASAARAHLNLSGHLHDTGEMTTALEHTQRARDLARRMGMASWEHDFTGTAAAIALEAGDFSTTETAIQAMRQLHGALLNPVPAASYTSFLEGNLLKCRGEWEEAIRLYRMSKEEARQRADAGLLADIDYNLAETLLERGEVSEAIQTLEEAIQLMRSAKTGKYHYHLAFPIYLLSKAFAMEGNLEAAHRSLEEAQAQVKGGDIHRTSACHAWAEAHLAALERRWPEALAGFEKAVNMIAQYGIQWDQARASLDWADALIARGEPADLPRARELLSDTLTRFQKMKAARYVTLVEGRLQSLQPDRG